MLPKRNRFSKSDKKNWHTLPKSKISSLFFDVVYSLSPDLKPPKIAITVGSSVSKSSVKRHLVKRIISEGLLRLVAGLPSGRYVVIVKKTALNNKTGVVWENLTGVFNKFSKKPNP